MSMITTSVLNNVLTADEISARVPLALASAPTARMSDRYVFIPTTTLIEDMANMGWQPVLATGKGKRANAKRKSSFHMIAFENADEKYLINRTDENGNTTIEGRVRIIVTNSHDGSSSFTFRIGIFRMICENGLVISTSEFSAISVRHINYTFEQLREVVAKATASIDAQIATMNEMVATELTDDQKAELAVSALKIRKGLELTDDLKVDDETITDILTPNRDEDEGNSLWLVYNTLQENIIKGGKMLAIDGKKPRKMRSIKSAIKDISINERLFNTAYAYANVG